MSVSSDDRDRADIFRRHRLRITVAEHFGQRIRRLKFREITIANELEQRPIGVECAPVAGDQGAHRKTVQNRARVAPNLIVIRAAGRRSIALAARRLFGEGIGPELPSIVGTRPFVGGIVA